MKYRKMLILIVFLLSFTLVGCNGGNVVTREDESLHVGYISSGFPAVFMPWLSNQGISPTISSMVYSTLFNYDSDTDTFLPLLGDSWEYVVDPNLVPEEQDYLEVKVELNRDAVWSDGTPVTVEDVYFTFDLASDFSRSNHAGTLAWTGDLMHDYNADRSGELVRQGIFTHEHPGDYTFSETDDNVVYFHVKKVLGAITPLFTTILVLPEHEYNIISQEVKLNTTSPTPELSHLFKNPMGCGPYTLDVDNSGPGIIVLNRREDYHIKDDDGGLLYKVETIKFINYLDEVVAINALKNGDIDVIDNAINNIYVDNLKQTDHVEVDVSPSSYIQALVFNINVPEQYSTPERELLNDPILRQAISMGIDQQYLIDEALLGEGDVVSSGLFASNNMYINDELPVNPYNLEQANQLLEDNGYVKEAGAKFRSKDGVELSFKITSHPGNKATVNYIKVLLEQIGIEITYHEGGSNATRDYFYIGDFDITIQGIVFEMSNVDMMMKAHFTTIGYSSNYGRLENEALNAKIDEMRTTLDYDRKVELIKEIQADVSELYYKVPLYSQRMSSAYRTDIFSGWQHVDGAIIYNSETLQNLIKND